MDDSFYLWVFISPIAIIILVAIIKAFTTTPSQSLNKKFVELGVLTGKHYDDIVAVVGIPNSTSAIGEGAILCQWILPAYHIALLFDQNMVCLGVESETRIDEV